MGGYKSFILDQRMYLNKLKSINDVNNYYYYLLILLLCF